MNGCLEFINGVGNLATQLYVFSTFTRPRPVGSNTTRKNTLLPDSRYSFGFSAPADIAMPIVAAYRVFLDEQYNWVIPFDQFAEDFLQHL
ncbi:hypothetical protein A6770_22220 [Nostoc minutum NIES-26]|uniref:Uncharacterized protein n=1 Tax=Nostoc minutum NIES-26 TaxID=1844469 RepID=A0A367QZ14_9NOSO|nr:hypothetical protein A6770_22220 [Nostoc minutum NIES-26]